MMLQYEVEKLISISSPKRIHEVLEQNEIDIVLLDMNFQAGINSGNEGLFWMKEILKHDSNISVVMITAYGDVELAVKALREGAIDFILKPWDNEKAYLLQ
jgi:DNA-binding NtrC family response regulator